MLLHTPELRIYPCHTLSDWTEAKKQIEHSTTSRTLPGVIYFRWHPQIRHGLHPLVTNDEIQSIGDRYFLAINLSDRIPFALYLLKRIWSNIGGCSGRLRIFNRVETDKHGNLVAKYVFHIKKFETLANAIDSI